MAQAVARWGQGNILNVTSNSGGARKLMGSGYDLEVWSSGMCMAPTRSGKVVQWPCCQYTDVWKFYCKGE